VKTLRAHAGNSLGSKNILARRTSWQRWGTFDTRLRRLLYDRHAVSIDDIEIRKQHPRLLLEVEEFRGSLTLLDLLQAPPEGTNS